MLRIESKVGTKGQAVIPKPIRDEMGIRPGDKVTFRIEDGRIVVEKERGEDVVEEFLNAFEKRKLPEDIDWDEAHYSQFEDEWPEPQG